MAFRCSRYNNHYQSVTFLNPHIDKQNILFWRIDFLVECNVNEDPTYICSYIHTVYLTTMM